MQIIPIKKILGFPMIVLVYILTIGSGFAQNMSIVDSLNSLLQKQKEDTIKVRIYNDLAWEYRHSDGDKAIEFANKAWRLSDSLGYEEGKITSLNRLGVVAIYQNDLDAAEAYYVQALERELLRGSLFGVGRAENQLSRIYKQRGNYERALEYSLCSLENFEIIDRKDLIALVANNIGGIYEKMGLFDKALAFYLQSLNVRERIGNSSKTGLTLLNLGSLHISLENYREAIDFLKKSLAALDVNNKFDQSKVYINLGLAHYMLNDDDLAIQYYEKAIGLKDELGLASKDFRIYNNLGALYHRQKKLGQALMYYQKSDSIQQEGSDGIKSAESKVNIADIYY